MKPLIRRIAHYRAFWTETSAASNRLLPVFDLELEPGAAFTFKTQPYPCENPVRSATSRLQRRFP
jgi:hypothetical protein